MTAAVLTAHGGPEVLDVRDDVPVPIPGPDAVLIKVTAAAVNNTDIWTREGAYGTAGDPGAIAGWQGVPLQFPRIQGTDIAGKIVAVGENVDTGRIGQRVIVDPPIYDSEAEDAKLLAVYGSEYDGGFAQFVVVDAERVHDVSESPLTDEQLACLPTAYGTAMGMLERASIQADEVILVTGASGGVGFALVQLAAARGARVIALTSEGNQEIALQAGAHQVVLRSSDDLADTITRVAGGPLDAIADVVGGSVFSTIIPLLRDAGRMVIAGAIAGPVVEFDLRVLYLHRRILIGSTMHTPAHFRRLLEFARRGSISPLVAQTYPLQKIHDAQRDFVEKRYPGKLVLLP
ncbi:MAG: Zn-dependent oxidoreductase [Sphaerobacteraceae bacterium]|nr:MAG: Zn-dependent oxidoreductase [Sphaerobacteraceae bacterium]